MSGGAAGIPQGEGDPGNGFFFFGGGSEAAPQPRCSPLTPLRARCRRLLTEEQKRLYSKVAQYCNRSTDLIPISFVLGTGPSPAPSQLGDAPSCPRAQTAPLPGAGRHSAPKATEHSSLTLFQDWGCPHLHPCGQQSQGKDNVLFIPNLSPLGSHQVPLVRARPRSEPPVPPPHRFLRHPDREPVVGAVHQHPPPRPADVHHLQQRPRQG